MREDQPPSPKIPMGSPSTPSNSTSRRPTRCSGCTYVIFRPHNVYGEYQNIGDRYRNVIGIFMNQIMQGTADDGVRRRTQTRAFSYVGDIAPGSPGLRGSTARAARCSTSGPTGATRSIPSPRRSPRRWADLDTPSSTSRRGTR